MYYCGSTRGALCQLFYLLLGSSCPFSEDGILNDFFKFLRNEDLLVCEVIVLTCMRTLFHLNLEVFINYELWVELPSLHYLIASMCILLVNNHFVDFGEGAVQFLS